MFKLFIVLFILSCSVTNASANEKIGVLYSYKNVETYNKNNIIDFEQTWEKFLEGFAETNLNYQFLTNISQESEIKDLGVNIIFFPLAVDISSHEQKLLNDFVKSGGKLIISSGLKSPSENLKLFLKKLGIQINDNVIANSNLVLKHKSKDVDFELPVGTLYSKFKLNGEQEEIIAKWKENNHNAIGKIGNVIYVGYSWGQDFDKDNDAKAFIYTIDSAWQDISVKLTRKITKEEFDEIIQDIASLQEEAKLVVEISKRLNLSVPTYQLRKHFENGLDYFNDFSTNYLFGNYKLARENANAAKDEFAFVYSLGIPVRKVEIRAIWLDRGNIVSCSGPGELKKLIRNLARVGFNVIFFETINAGYPIYPSKLLPQNPLVKEWDPLEVAVEAAHENGIELHVWAWTFAVANTKHNLLINKPIDYTGPVLSVKDKSWALTNQEGDLRIEMQPEMWVSPANKEACDFLKELFVEIVENYDIDGFQFDYIRFPFQKKHSQVGFDDVTKKAFKKALGKAPALQGKNNKIWTEWKATVVSDFVRETSKKLKDIKPNLKVSAAVFAIDRSLRLQQIQQDWETWLINKWIDAVYPFYYSYTKEEMKTKLTYEQQLVDHKGIIIPAFNLSNLNIAELAERITEARSVGVLGVAFFAVEHLDDLKSSILRNGPFRERTILTPDSEPLLACQKLVSEFSTLIQSLFADDHSSVLSISKEQNELYALIKKLESDFNEYDPKNINEIKKTLTELQLKLQNILSLEKYLDREQRAMYITSYLSQLKTLLNYIKTES